MTPEEKKASEIDATLKAANAKKRADAEETERNAGERLDKMLACLDSITKRMDGFESMMADKAKKDDSEIKEKGDPREMTVDPNEDADEIAATAKERGEDAPRADSARFQQIADSILATEQSFADKAYSAWGKSARAPWDGERPSAYRRRIAEQLQQHSPAWKAVNLRELRGQALVNAVRTIYADAFNASKSSDSIGPGFLREVVRRGEGGHTFKEFYGDPMSWMSQFTGQRRSARFNLNRNNDR